MERRDIQKLLEDVRSRKLPVAGALEQLRHLPYEDLGFAKLDHHRGLRQGFAEVIYARGKTPAQVAVIARGLLRPRTHHNLLVTRANAAVFRAVRRVNRAAEFHALSGAITIRRNREIVGKGTILIVAAGTSDIPVAEEAAVTAGIMGNTVDTVYDVGVAGLHRLLHHRENLAAARVIVCVAGMEGALPSVVAGLVSVPVIAVPTSVGYGASFGGVAALLGMLNSCASNVSVVNIDNGFGAGYVASTVNRL
ncbi:MAG TPA: nickel pincer cofactor biosynthesis protein LarB [Bryobacteraceae bacterium]|nr:nickel pincer cofactor biosynthesis protein LarB [Bryobacteraceae bacterium]